MYVSDATALSAQLYLHSFICTSPPHAAGHRMASHHPRSSVPTNANVNANLDPTVGGGSPS